MVGYTPEKGDIVWIDFSPTRGHEQAGVRPVLVLSPNMYNAKSGLMVACPITSKVKGYPFEVRIQAKKINGVVLADQIKNLDWQARKVSFEERAPESAVTQSQELIEVLVLG